MNTPLKNKKKLSRVESKAATRQRLLDSAYRLILEEGITAVSMNRVTKLAGIAQPSFYTHFNNLAGLIDELAIKIKKDLLFPMQQALVATFTMEGIEDKSIVLERLYRLLVEGMFANNFLMQQALERHQPNSLFGQHIQSFYVDLKSEWLKFLIQNSINDVSAVQQERYSMAIDCIFAMSESLVLGLSRGEYQNKDNVIHILTEFTNTHFGELIDQIPAPKAPSNPNQ